MINFNPAVKMPVTKLVDYNADVRVLNGRVLRERGFRISPVGNYAFVSYREPRSGGETIVSGPIPEDGVVIGIRGNKVVGKFVSASNDKVLPEVEEKLIAGIENFLGDGYVGNHEKVEIVSLGRSFVTVRVDGERRRSTFAYSPGGSVRKARFVCSGFVNHKKTSDKSNH